MSLPNAQLKVVDKLAVLLTKEEWSTLVRFFFLFVPAYP